ncbi:glycosyltransferase family 4 protein [Actinomadura sp. PM05-2]|uniref:Glycosyltransferase family 4 protein n=1 Tax=Actinomadura parmotrematis TaxID=2864039 RepID=A0ABS7FLT7_9ACTN|nr:glycosyltransferase family 4 protein [Actinomadura parmotrematis]
MVLPGGVDDPAAPSGGNVYDRRVCDELVRLGRPVHEIVAPGGWPRPGPAAREHLAGALAALPAGAPVLLDGLVACGVPELLEPHAGRLRLAVLVHLPLADETGLTGREAADLDARERAVLHAAGLTVATSGWAARRLADHHGLPAGRVHAVPPGTDAAPLAPATADGTRLLCLASVTPRKGQDVLVQALASIADLPWTCECAGPLGRDLGYVARLRRLIERRGLGGRVLLTGPRPRTRLGRADLLVLPSRAETFGMAVTEALARGVPAVASEVGGVPEALGDGPPGLLVPPGDDRALAAALRRWLTEPGLRAALRTAARARRAALPTWADAARRLDAVVDLLPEGAR